MTTGVPNPGGSSAPVSYDVDARALFARMTPTPNATRKKLISDTIARLKAVGAWANIKGLYVFAAHSQQAGLLNWTGLAGTDATLTGAPTFAADKGFGGFNAANILAMPMGTAQLGTGGTGMGLGFAGLVRADTTYNAGTTVQSRSLILSVNASNGTANSPSNMSFLTAQDQNRFIIGTFNPTLVAYQTSVPVIVGQSQYVVTPGCETVSSTSILTPDVKVITANTAAAAGLTRLSMMLFIPTGVAGTAQTPISDALQILSGFLSTLGALK